MIKSKAVKSFLLIGLILLPSLFIFVRVARRRGAASPATAAVGVTIGATIAITAPSDVSLGII